MKQYWGEKTTKKVDAQKPDGDKYITVHENKIYFYSGVSRSSVVELNKKIGEI